MSKKKFHHGNLKQALLDATLKLIDAKAVSAVTIRAVAEETGVSHAAPVNHYRDRRELLTAAANVVFNEILEMTDRRLAASDVPVRERLFATAHVLYEYAMKHPNRYAFIWRSDLVDHENEALLKTMDTLYYKYCIQDEASAPKTGFDHDTLAVMMWSMVHGYVDLRMKGMFEERKDGVTGQERLPAMIDLLKGAIFNE